jgi:hypothetical protein
MDGARKLKISLDETRMLILGAQVLLGFQLRGPFEKLFETLGPLSKGAHAVSLLLMVTVVGLLIAPGAHHRMIDDGHATLRMHHAISRVMEVTLALFAVSLALSLFVTFGVIGGRSAGLGAGLIAALVALFFWFGLGFLAWKGKPMVQTTDQRVPLPLRIEQLLTEARVILPGAQTLLGFQLAAVMTEAFSGLSFSSKIAHGFALACIALCTTLLMAPAAYHRIVYDGEASPDFLRIGTQFLLASTGALALGLAADAYVVIGKLSQSDIAGRLAGASTFVVLVLMWHISPIVLRGYKKSKHGPPYEGK